MGRIDPLEPTRLCEADLDAPGDKADEPPLLELQELPHCIGRYRVQKLLGRGGFGIVYLAFDEQLDRRVAVKVPRLSMFADLQNTAGYLAEARMVAGLDHPHIVPVYDVGSTEDYPCYIVSKYVEGGDLLTRLKGRPLDHCQVAALIATVAEALHYAHTQGLVHRDIKPGNILVGFDDQPYIADFGLALREQDLGKGPRFVGTTAYMSPEQARGEGHRVDGRTDIYSLGGVLYLLLTGRRALSAGTPFDVREQIASVDPKPLRQIDDRIPRELERICLKALSKRATERYTTAADLAIDLRLFIAENALPQPLRNPVGASLSLIPADPSSSLISIVPKGLRAFDAHDADFFLELVPGSRDRDGLPESLRFWKTHVEETDPDATFPVGLLYGPSGCGKSSLIRAGLLPRLSQEVISIYVEASADNTEADLLRGIRKACPGLSHASGLKETLAAMRRGEGVASCKKVLIVIDQFEQWLHARKDKQDSELVQALRQCDGGNVQCLVLSRDDFWLAVSRFFRDLEIPIQERHNSSLVDLFDCDHARRILAAFGRAFGRLPPRAAEMTDEQQKFVRQSVAGLAEENKVICVRLALFAEMMKYKSWTTATLREMGGAQGVGVTFLEEMFGDAAARPECRVHRQAARAVLGALLPESGSDIRGKMRSREHLVETSGYVARTQEFDELIGILDGELRLITPADPAGHDPNRAPPSDSDSHGRCYQLTHDYLVRPLRDWLTRKQKQTRRGRAELRLIECAALWNAKQERRQLPAWWEYLSILALTRRALWTDPQRRMLKSAGRTYGIQALLGLMIVLTILAGAGIARHQIQQAQERARIDGLVSQLLVAEISKAPPIISLLEQSPNVALPILIAAADDPARAPADRLRATLALASRPGPRASLLIQNAATADLETLLVIHDRLRSFGPQLSDELWEAALQDSATLPARLRIGTLLAMCDPQGSEWHGLAPSIVDALLTENTLDLDVWVELLRPVADRLTPRLRQYFLDESATTNDRVAAARALARYADAPLLAELLLEADAPQFAALFPGTARYPAAIIDTLSQSLPAVSEPVPGRDPVQDAKRSRNAAIALLRLNRPNEVQSILAACADPTARTMMLLELREFGVPAGVVLSSFNASSDPAVRQALLLAFDRYRTEEIPAQVQRELDSTLLNLLRDGPHQAERSAAEWLLRRRSTVHHSAAPANQSAEVAITPETWLENHDWCVTAEGHTLAVIRGPVTFVLGSPENEPGRDPSESQTTSTISHSFALGIHEVTMQQFQRFRVDADFAWDVADDPLCPANKVFLVGAMQYCRWLSEQEHVPEDQMCYPPVDQINATSAVLPETALLRTGYRLPTEAEWEFACRANSTTTWASGANPENLPGVAWLGLNSGDRLHPVGLLLPNAFGFFDMVGNVMEWCHSSRSDTNFVLRGGGYRQLPKNLGSARRYFHSEAGYSFTGFRIARTVPAPLTPGP